MPVYFCSVIWCLNIPGPAPTPSGLKTTSQNSPPPQFPTHIFFWNCWYAMLNRANFFLHLTFDKMPIIDSISLSQGPTKSSFIVCITETYSAEVLRCDSHAFGKFAYLSKVWQQKFPQLTSNAFEQMKVKSGWIPRLLSLIHCLMKFPRQGQNMNFHQQGRT